MTILKLFFHCWKICLPSAQTADWFFFYVLWGKKFICFLTSSHDFSVEFSLTRTLIKIFINLSRDFSRSKSNCIHFLYNFYSPQKYGETVIVNFYSQIDKNSHGTMTVSTPKKLGSTATGRLYNRWRRDREGDKSLICEKRWFSPSLQNIPLFMMYPMRAKYTPQKMDEELKMGILVQLVPMSCKIALFSPRSTITHVN